MTMKETKSFKRLKQKALFHSCEFLLAIQLFWEIVIIEVTTCVMNCHVLVDNPLCSGTEWYLQLSSVLVRLFLTISHFSNVKRLVGYWKTVML